MAEVERAALPVLRRCVKNFLINAVESRKCATMLDENESGRLILRMVLSLLAVLTLVPFGLNGYAQETPFDRLPPEQFGAAPPTDRVEGAPGEMSIRRTSCEILPTGDTRRRIVDIAVQEWGFFGFTIVDQTRVEERPQFTVGVSGVDSRRRFRRRDPVESARVADSIAGYWAVTPDGAWILDRQNAAWNGRNGVAARWRDPWSAAFVSWVMCEGGLGDRDQFRRAIAHHTYIDQAIRARDGVATGAAFVAYDVGDTAIEPGDLLCSGRRPAYQTIAERRRQIGAGARTHCDIVVKLDESDGRILAIGGNVRGSVSLKLLPAVRSQDYLRPIDGGGRPLFAHLKLQADPIELNALDDSPMIQTLPCAGDVPTQFAARSRALSAAADVADRC